MGRRATGVTALALVAIAALGVWAVAGDRNGQRTFRSTHKAIRWQTRNQATSSDTWRWVDGMSMMFKHRGPTAVTVTGNVSGGPVEFQLAGRAYKPKLFAVDPGSQKQTFSFTTVWPGDGDWGCSRADLRWRSPEGSAITLHAVNMAADFKKTSPEPDFACRSGRARPSD